MALLSRVQSYGLLVLLSGCTTDTPAQIVVQAEGNLRAAEIEFEVSAPGSGRLVRGSCSAPLPYSFGVSRSVGSPAGSLRVRALAKTHAGQFVRSVAEASFIDGQALLLSIPFDRECLLVPGSPALNCTASETCIKGRCESIYRSNLPKLDPERDWPKTEQCSPFGDVGPDGALNVYPDLFTSGGSSGMAGAAGVGGSSGGTTGDAIGGTAGVGGAKECAPGFCCIAGNEVFPGARQRGNACLECDPAKSVASFSPVPDETGCGTGCRCEAGRQVEFICNDALDNDADEQANCSDLDCSGSSCQPKTFARVSATKDYLRICCPGPNGSPLDEEGTSTLSPHNGQATGSHAVLEFESIPTAGAAMTVYSAELVLEVPAAGSLVVRDPAGNNLRVESSAGNRRVFNTTELVKAWVENAESRKYVTVHYTGGSLGSASIYALESDGRGPEMRVEYESRCLAGLCPKP